MKLTTKKLKQFIKEELEQIKEVDDMPHGGSIAGLSNPNRVNTICREISQGIRPSGMSDEEYESAKERCQDQRMYSSRAMAYRKGKEDEESYARARADKEARLSAKHGKATAKKFVKEFNRKNESFVERFFSEQYVFPKNIFDANSREKVDQIRSENDDIFGTGQYSNPIKMDVIEDAGGLGSFLEKTGAYVGVVKNNKVYIDPEKYLEAAKIARGISSKKKGFFGKLKSFVGLEESKISITSEQLRQIVNEELKTVIKEKQKK